MKPQSKMRLFSLRDSILLLVLIAIIPVLIIHFYTLTRYRNQAIAEYEQSIAVRNEIGRDSYDNLVLEQKISDINDTFTKNVLGMSIIGIFSLTLAGFVGTSLILRRVRRLSETAKKLRDGDLTVRTNITYSDDELGFLAQSFDEMAESIMIKNKQLSRMDEMKSDFFWMAAHQLRQPLSTILWNIELVLSSGVDQLKISSVEKLMKIQNSAKRLVSQISEILNIAKMQQYQFTDQKADIDIEKELWEVAGELEPEIQKKHLTINFKIDQNLHEIRVAKHHFREAVQNLIHNAVKYNSENGHIEVSAAKKDGFVEISVSDTGIGIPQNQHNKIFTRFFRATNVGGSEGAGIGLHLIKSYVEEWGGKIWFESEEGRGTTFHITIPYS